MPQRRPGVRFDFDERSAAIRAAQADLTAEETASARRLLRSGEPAADPRVARLVVALGEEEQLDSGLVVTLVIALICLIWAVARLAAYPLNAVTWVAIAAAVAVGIPAVRGTIHRFRVPRALEANRLLATAAEVQPVPHAPEPVALGPRRAALAVLPVLVSGAIAGAVLSLPGHHHRATVGAVVFGALLAGVIPSLFTLALRLVSRPPRPELTSATLATRGSRLIRASSRRAAVRSGIGMASASSTGSRLAV